MLVEKYADDTSLTPQHTNTGLEEKFLHIQSWAKENKLKIKTLKTISEIGFRRPSIRHYVPPTPIVQIEQVEGVKWLGVMLTSSLSANLHLNYIVGIINQRLYLLNQLGAQGLDINGLAFIKRRGRTLSI